jgi:hypothetical protein
VVAAVRVCLPAACRARCPHGLCAQEDLILPHHFSFYELIVNKARGKSGPLFDFGVKDDIRLLGDASVESQDVHAGKVGPRRAGHGDAQSSDSSRGSRH